MRGVILVPGSTAVWSQHPFALMPAQFWVEAKRGEWWANCAWCARHGHPRGAVIGIETGVRLAERWFGDYASSEWRRKTPEQAEASAAHGALRARLC
ncbi:MAG: hypothetical protein ACRD8O_03770 [Bryobacteraceae bacterium]